MRQRYLRVLAWQHEVTVTVRDTDGRRSRVRPVDGLSQLRNW
jgi:hypothetical protein